MPYKIVPDSFHTAITAEALRAKIDRKSAIWHQRGHTFYGPLSTVSACVPLFTRGPGAVIRYIGKRGHFRSRDKYGGQTIRSAMAVNPPLYANLTI